MLRLFRHYIPFPALTLAALDAMLFFAVLNTLLYFGIATLANVPLSGGAAGASGALPGASGPIGVAMVPAALTGVAVLAMSAVGLYNREVFFRMQTAVTRAATSFPLVLVVLLGLTYLYASIVRVDVQGYYGLCLAGIAISFPLTLLVRGVFIGVAHLEAFKRRVLVIGTGPRAAKIAALAAQAPQSRFHVIGYVRFNEESNAPGAGDPDGMNDHEGGISVDPMPTLFAGLLSTPARLSEFIRANRVDEIVIAARDRRGLPVAELLDCKLLGVRVSDYQTFFETETGRIDLDELQPSWLIFSDGFRLGRGRLLVQRVFDVVVATAILVLTLPVTVTTAALVRLTSPGPVFYRQERVGLGGRSFDVLKFRTMRSDAEKDGPQWATAGDDRITPIGHVLRRSRIDEIPQVLTVLKGDMSFIGPRPERPVFVAELARRIPYYAERHRVKPGITGWAQVNYPYGASVEDARRKLAYDLYYLKNGGLFLDAVILLQTVRVILWREGAR